VQSDAHHCFKVFLNCFSPERQAVSLLLLGSWVIQASNPEKTSRKVNFHQGFGKGRYYLLTMFHSCPWLDRHATPTEVCKTPIFSQVTNLNTSIPQSRMIHVIFGTKRLLKAARHNCKARFRVWPASCSAPHSEAIGCKVCCLLSQMMRKDI